MYSFLRVDIPSFVDKPEFLERVYSRVSVGSVGRGTGGVSGET